MVSRQMWSEAMNASVEAFPLKERSTRLRVHLRDVPDHVALMIQHRQRRDTLIGHESEGIDQRLVSAIRR